LLHTIQTRRRAEDGSARLPGRRDGRSLVTVGDVVDVAIADRGALVWRAMTFGMLEREDGAWRLTSAGEDSLDRISRWMGLIRLRCAVPLFGYRPRSGEWTETPAGWGLGFFEIDHDAGSPLKPGLRDAGPDFVLVTTGAGTATTPVLVAWDAARDWLLAEQWEALPLLRDARRLLADHNQRMTG
jgi:hypothetical protein